jgi:hypothetical protein
MAVGCVNEAEHTIYEALEVLGPRPYILRQLAMINIVKDRTEAARVFLRLLRRDLVYGHWAEGCLERLDSDARLESDPEVARMRRFLIRDDHIVVPDFQLFELAYQQNPNNRMAFDYMMAYYLLTCQSEKVVEHVSALRDLGFDRIPTHYAEAALMHWQATGQQPDLDGWQIDRETAARFESLLHLMRDPERDARSAARAASGTYYEYFFIHKAPSL